ncbi:MAG: aldo/keto reductase [Demequinaceae bacterium]|nr:aldo/keto reductase [Demequinaceae bacterium]
MAVPTRTLNDGVSIPAIGFGTNSLRGDAGLGAIRSALECGYRLIDCAVNSRNEVEVGRSVREFLRATETPRDEIFVQTKIPGHLHDSKKALDAYQISLELLGLERIDVLLLHSPNFMAGKYRDAWRTLVDLRQSGAVRSIGVSNFTAQSISEIILSTGITPAVHQMELHPWHAQERLRAENARLGIVTQSWSPRGSGDPQNDTAPVVSAATAHGVTPDQVILRWHLQLGNIPLPMSMTPSERCEHLSVFGFELSEAEMAAISSLSGPGANTFGSG